MPGYYEEKLAADRLRRCYEIAPPAVQAYLEGEIAYLISRISRRDDILELGCGYGRVLEPLLPHGRWVWGIDTSFASLALARDALARKPRVSLAAMDALALAFPDRSFDVVACVQNGISAFGGDREVLVREALRVTRPGGRVLFSSYAARFWPERLAWFELQAAEGLIGEIDHEATGRGVIVCRDGFRATTVDPEGFTRLGRVFGLEPHLTEIAGASLFCEWVIPERRRG